MVDVTAKDVTDREAVATGTVRMAADTRAAVLARTLDKGDALEVARIAGIMAAKRTSELIPLCHPIAIGAVEVAFGRSSRAGSRSGRPCEPHDRTGRRDGSA